MTRLLWLAVSPLLLTGCQASESEPGPERDAALTPTAEGSMANVAPTPTTPDAAAYVGKAGAGDMFEIESSRAIVTKTANDEVRSFAQMMIDNHTDATAKIKAAAKQGGITVTSPELDPMQQQKLDEIKRASGQDADRAYLAAQRAAHEEALALHRGYSTGGDNAPLRTAASEVVKIVQNHIEALGKLPSN